MTRVLLADDDKDLRELLKKQLENNGFDVTEVSSGADAIVEAVENHYDILLLDMLMPGLEGIQTVRVLRRVTPEMEILAMAAYIGQRYLKQTQSLLVQTISKPFHIADLIKEMNALLANRNPSSP